MGSELVPNGSAGWLVFGDRVVFYWPEAVAGRGGLSGGVFFWPAGPALLFEAGPAFFSRVLAGGALPRLLPRENITVLRNAGCAAKLDLKIYV